MYARCLTHWGRVTRICVSRLAIIGSDNGLSPDRRQAIIWNNDRILLIGPLGTTFSEILIKILTFSFKKMRLKVSSAKWRPFCLCLNVLMTCLQSHISNYQGWFCLRTFSENIGLNLLHWKSLVSGLHSQLGYSKGVFQAFWLVVLVVFGTMDWPLAYHVRWSTCWQGYSTWIGLSIWYSGL